MLGGLLLNSDWLVGLFYLIFISWSTNQSEYGHKSIPWYLSNPQRDFLQIWPMQSLELKTGLILGLQPWGSNSSLNLLWQRCTIKEGGNFCLKKTKNYRFVQLVGISMAGC